MKIKFTLWFGCALWDPNLLINFFMWYHVESLVLDGNKFKKYKVYLLFGTLNSLKILFTCVLHHIHCETSL